MAVIWLLAYQLVYMGAAALWEGTYLVSCAMAGYTLILWTYCRKRNRPLGLTWPASLGRRELLRLLPLVSAPVWNLFVADTLLPDFSVVLVVLSAAVAEELVFRGLFLCSFAPLGKRWSIALSALLFSAYHGIQVFSGCDPGETALQTVFSLLAGICFGQIALGCHSLLPGMVLHGLINLTGCMHTGFTREHLGSFWLCLACYGAAALWYARRDRKK